MTDGMVISVKVPFSAHTILYNSAWILFKNSSGTFSFAEGDDFMNNRVSQEAVKMQLEEMVKEK